MSERFGALLIFIQNAQLGTSFARLFQSGG